MINLFSEKDFDRLQRALDKEQEIRVPRKLVGKFKMVAYTEPAPSIWEQAMLIRLETEEGHIKTSQNFAGVRALKEALK